MRRFAILLASLIAFFGIADAGSSYSVRISSPPVPEKLTYIFKKCAARHNIDWLYLSSVFSAGEHSAKWPTKGPWASSPVGANGPWQFMPGTWPSWDEDGDNDGDTQVQSLHDASCSAARYLASGGARNVYGLENYKLNKLAEAAARYNAGPNTSVQEGMRIPETRTYVLSVIATYKVLSKHYKGDSKRVTPKKPVPPNPKPTVPAAPVVVVPVPPLPAEESISAVPVEDLQIDLSHVQNPPEQLAKISAAQATTSTSTTQLKDVVPYILILGIVLGLVFVCFDLFTSNRTGGEKR